MQEMFSRALDIKWHWFCNFASDWLQLETQETPQSGQHVRRSKFEFQVSKECLAHAPAVVFLGGSARTEVVFSSDFTGSFLSLAPIYDAKQVGTRGPHVHA